MKRYGNLYQKIYEFDNLHKSYLLARRNKRYKKNILEFSINLEENLIQIQNELIWRKYKTGEYREFYIYEPKKRLIKALDFKDRVVQHAINNIIEPIFENIFIYDSYACRKNRGIHIGVARLTEFLRKSDKYDKKIFVLKSDIKSYFSSIDHQILLRLIEKKIKCKDTLNLLQNIINSNGYKGVPIGNLTSQLFANIYLNQLDHFVKENLEIKWYIRYMDDFIILHQEKDILRDILKEINIYLNNQLKLELNKKTSIFPAKHGIDFLGYRIWKTHRLLRKSNIIKFKRTLNKFKKLYKDKKISFDRINSTIQSWIGHAKHANTFNLRRKIFEKFLLRSS